MAIYLDAGTTYSKVISEDRIFDEKFCLKNFDGKNYYILPSKLLKEQEILPTRACGHMAQADENEIIALANGALKSNIDKDATVLDMGSRDAKWIKFNDGKFRDMDWNTSCASSTGATVEMLMKFYDVSPEELKYNDDRYTVTCGIFGMEKIMDAISNGTEPAEAISKFIHGIAYNAWNFAQKPDKIYLSGGFCQNACFIDSLGKYCEVVPLGRFLLCEGLVR